MISEPYRDGDRLLYSFTVNSLLLDERCQWWDEIISLEGGWEL